jgi:hypothetical protein
MATQTIGTPSSVPLSGSVRHLRLPREAARRALRWRKTARAALSTAQNLILGAAFTAAAAIGLALALALGGVLAF